MSCVSRSRLLVNRLRSYCQKPESCWLGLFALVNLIYGWWLLDVLSNGWKSFRNASRRARSSSLRLMPLIKSAYRYDPKNQILARTIGPPSDRSDWLTAWYVGRPPGATPPLVLSPFQLS